MLQCDNTLRFLLQVFCLLLLFYCAASSVRNELDLKMDRLEPPPEAWVSSGALTRSVFVERQERLQFNCDNIFKDSNATITDTAQFHNFLVDEMHKLLYCYVPKVACTNWKRILMLVMGKWKGNDPLAIPADQAHAMGTFKRLSNYTMLEINEKLKTYDKFIIVRHPLERLLSAYRNKFENKNEYFQSRFGKLIIKKYRSNATEESLRTGKTVTFQEFVDFITDSDNRRQNEHWQPISELCYPCSVNFNIISKYESLAEDAVGILERMDAKSIIFPTPSPLIEATSKKLDKYYSTLSYKQLQKLIEMYRTDLMLFDYSLEDILGFSLA